MVARGFATVHNVPAERALPIPDTGIPLQRWIVEQRVVVRRRAGVSCHRCRFPL